MHDWNQLKKKVLSEPLTCELMQHHRSRSRPRIYNWKNRGHIPIPDDAVWVDRKTPYGNRFEIGKHGTREECVAKFVKRQLPNMDVSPLRGKSLICHCWPLQCHAVPIFKKANGYDYDGSDDHVIKVIAIMGEPCTGKSRIAKRLLKIGAWKKKKRGLVKYHRQENTGTILLGRYEDDEQFPGTDKLSMAVQPQVIEFLKTVNNTVIFEGDRLCNWSMFNAIINMGMKLRIYHVQTDAKILRKRRDAERDQSSSFLKRQKTKVDNLVKHFPAYVIPMQHDNKNDTLEAVNTLQLDLCFR